MYIDLIARFMKFLLFIMSETTRSDAMISLEKILELVHYTE